MQPGQSPPEDQPCSRLLPPACPPGSLGGALPDTAAERLLGSPLAHLVLAHTTRNSVVSLT